jgi:Fic family protein
MKYIYGDHPTRKELITLAKDSKKADAEWRKLQKEWMVKSEKISLESKDSKPFWFLLSPYLLSLITRVSEERGFLEALSISGSQRKKIEEKATNYEAYYSSHIEGAESTLEEALKFIKKKQKLAPNESLQMIGNNKRGLEYALKQFGKPISHEFICKLQLILTENTHKERPITMGEYRHGPVYIVNGLGQVIYEGPPAKKVPEMMDRFVEWINADDNRNPLIKAGIVHLYFVHVHPFDDGNGRTARALSNLVLTNLGFKFVNMLSLSSYFDYRRPSYYKAIQDVREHGYDLTYFLIFYLEALLSKLEDFKKEIEIDSKVKNVKELMSQDLYRKLSRRQIKALRVMIRKSEEMTTRKYCKINKCSDETARKDFIDLVNLKIIESLGKGRSRKYKLIV